MGNHVENLVALGLTDEQIRNTLAEKMAYRQAALVVADDFVRRVADRHTPEEYKNTQVVKPFTSPNTITYTPMEQVISSTLEVARWLVEEPNS